jgi:hypothetical protein
LLNELDMELSEDFNEVQWNMLKRHSATMKWLHSGVLQTEDTNGEMTAVIDWQQAPLANGGFQEGGTVVEIGLLLEPSLLEGLEEVAQEQGMAAASLIRRLLRDFLHHPAASQRIAGTGSRLSDASAGFG